jgi:3-hydroxymyristoyl/3-hydroxydecanoyl-(acyl carrier protein) dehydratase
VHIMHYILISEKMFQLSDLACDKNNRIFVALFLCISF